MKLRRVDPQSIKVPEVRVRAQFDEELFKQFRESIIEVGQIAPPIVYQVGEELVLCDGEHRLTEAKQNGQQMIEVIVIPGDMVDVLTKNIFLDHLRGKTPVSEMVKVVKVLNQDYKLDPDQIKEKTGLTRDYIEKLIKISTASPVVGQALDEGVIGVGHAFELSRLPSQIQQEEMIAKLQIYRFPIKELHEFIDQVLAQMEVDKTEAPPGVDRGKRPPAVYKCEGCQEETEPRYLRPVMVCPDCFGVVWKLGKMKKTPEVEVKDEGGGMN